MVTPILEQLRLGITPEQIAMTIAAGAALGVFPILGTTTALCFLFALALRLNQPVIQMVNYLVYPLQVPLIYVFVRVGASLSGMPPASFRVTELVAAFAANPLAFLRDFALVGLHGMTGWLVVAAPLAGIIYLLLLPLLRRFGTTVEVPSC